MAFDHSHSSHHRSSRTDKFGNEYKLVSCKANDKGFAKGFIEISGQLYKVEPSKAQKEGVAYWVKVTKLKKRSKSSF